MLEEFVDIKYQLQGIHDQYCESSNLKHKLNDLVLFYDLIKIQLELECYKLTIKTYFAGLKQITTKANQMIDAIECFPHSRTEEVTKSLNKIVVCFLIFILI